MIGLVSQLRVGIVLRVLHIEILVLTDAGAPQIFVEGLHGLFGANVAKDAVCTKRFATTLRRPYEFQLDVISIFDRPTLDGRKRGGALTHLLESLVHIFISNVHRRHFEVETFIVGQLEFRQNLENRAEFQRLTFRKIKLVYLWLRDRRQLLLADGLLNAFGNQRLDYFTLDVISEPPADQGYRGLAWPKAGNARHTRELLCDTLHRFGYFLRGNLQVEFAAAASFSHATILSCSLSPGAIGSEVKYSLVVSRQTRRAAREEARQVRITL